MFLTYNNTVLLVSLHTDGGDITELGPAQRAEEAGLAVLMTGQQLPVCHHQAAWDTGGGGHTLRDHLEGGGREGEMEREMKRE